MQKTGRNPLPSCFASVVCLFETFAAPRLLRDCRKTATAFFIWLILCASLLAPSAFATNYSFINAGDWTNPENWAPSYPGTTIAEGDVVQIQADCIIPSAVTVINNGVFNVNYSININNNAVLTVAVGGIVNTENGSITNNPGGLMTIVGGVNVYGSGAIHNRSTFDLDGGTVNVYNNAHIYNGISQTEKTAAVLNNNAGMLIIQNSGILDNYETLNNNGTLTLLPVNSSINNFSVLNNNKNGTIAIHGFLYNYSDTKKDYTGTINNGGTIMISSLGRLINDVGGSVFNNNDGGTLRLTGNSSTPNALVQNYSILNNNEGGTLESYGLFHNCAEFNNYGTVNLYNNSDLHNLPSAEGDGGVLNNYADLNMDSDGDLHNYSTLNNYGTLIFNNNSDLNNHSILNNVGTLEGNGGNLFNHAELNNDKGGVFNTGNSLIENFAPDGVINNAGTLNVTGSFRNRSTLNNNGGILNVDKEGDIDSSFTFNNNAGSQLNVNNGGTLETYSVLNNNADAVMNINEGGVLEASRRLNNRGNIVNNGALNVNSGGTLKITDNAWVDNFSTLRVNGGLVNIEDDEADLFNYSMLNIINGGTLHVEQGELHNHATLNTSPTNSNVIIEGSVININGKETEAIIASAGLVEISGSLQNYAVFSNGKPGRVNINSGGVLKNFAAKNSGETPSPAVNNDGILNINDGGVIENYSLLNNKIGATLNNNSGGTLNNHSGGEFYNHFKLNNNGDALLNNDGAMFSDNPSSFPAALNNSGELNIGSGGSLTNYKEFNLDGGNVNNLGVFIVTETGTLSRTANGGHVIGKLTKTFGAGNFTFHVGTMNGYSPVTLSNVAGNGDFTVAANEGAYNGAATGLPANRLARWWQLDNDGLLAADITFNYLQSDITAGIEANYKAFRITGETAQVSITTLDAANNTATVTNVAQFSPWTLAELAPTAAAVSIAGRIMTASGDGLSKATVVLTDSSGNSRTVISNPFGYYRFDEVRAGETYILTVLSKSHQFTPLTVTVNEDVENLNLTALP